MNTATATNEASATNPLAGKLSAEDMALFNQHIASQVGISVAEVEKRMSDKSVEAAMFALGRSKAYTNSMFMHMFIGMAAGAALGLVMNRFGIPGKIASIFTSSTEEAAS